MTGATLLWATLACGAEGTGTAAASGPGDAAPASVASSPGSPEVAATLGGEPIPVAEVDAKILEGMGSQELYEARRNVVQEMVEKRLLEREAGKRNLTPEALIAEEVTGKASDVSDADVSAFYEENKEQLGGQTLEELGPRIRSFLAQGSQSQRRRAYLDELKKSAGFEWILEPPRMQIDVAADEPAKGPASAPITIVEYSDFQCPYCARVLPTMEQVMKKYGEQVRLVYRDYPLSFHAQAQIAAEAAQCAHAQGKFWDYHDKLFSNQDALEKEALQGYAAELGLDTETFDSCIEAGTYSTSVTADTQGGSALGVSGTPAFFINGRFISGAQPLQAFQEIIDEELERSATETGS